MKQSIQPFFIRKNTKELRDKLKELGIEENCYVCDWDDVNKWLMVIPSLQHDYISFLTAKPHIQNIPNIIDCGMDETLFMGTLENIIHKMSCEK